GYRKSNEAAGSRLWSRGARSPASRASGNEKESSVEGPSVAKPSPLPLSERERELFEEPSVAKPSFQALSHGEREPRGLMPRVVQVIAIIVVLLTSVAVFSAVKFGAFRVVPGPMKAMRGP